MISVSKLSIKFTTLAASVSLLYGCVSVQNTFSEIKEGSLTGGVKLGLAEASISFTKNEKSNSLVPRTVFHGTGPHYEMSPSDKFYTETSLTPVSYTHLTLPTILLV